MWPADEAHAHRSSVCPRSAPDHQPWRGHECASLSVAKCRRGSGRGLAFQRLWRTGMKCTCSLLFSLLLVLCRPARASSPMDGPDALQILAKLGADCKNYSDENACLELARIAKTHSDHCVREAAV